MRQRGRRSLITSRYRIGAATGRYGEPGRRGDVPAGTSGRSPTCLVVQFPPRPGAPMRTTPSLLALVLTFGLIVHAGAPSLSAQESAVAPGTRIRFKVRDGERYEGRVISLRPEALEAGFPTNGATAKYQITDLEKLEVQQGRHRPVLRGGLVGTGAGIVLGGAVGAMTYSPCGARSFWAASLPPESRTQAAGVGAPCSAPPAWSSAGCRDYSRATTGGVSRSTAASFGSTCARCRAVGPGSGWRSRSDVARRYARARAPRPTVR